MDKGHVLVVDDEREILASLEDVLLDEGYRVERAESGETALQLVQTEAPDVVLVDVWMPGIDGIQTLQAVKESNADVEVVVMSGHGNIETAVAATKLGAFNFIEKPLSIDTVLRIVDSAVQARRAREMAANDADDAMLDGASRKIENIRRAIRKAAKGSGPLVIAGERGTGKRLVARLIHTSGAGKGAVFRSVHCRALLPLGEEGEWNDVLERLAPGASPGTLYLDGLEQLPAARRGRLVKRFLAHLGDAARLVVSLDHLGTTKDKNQAQSFSKRIGAELISLPPLRERKEDILPLAEKFLGECPETAREGRRFSADLVSLLEEYDWPGNIAELKGAITKAASTSRGPEIHVAHLPYAIRESLEPESEAARGATSSFDTARTQWERHYLSFHLEQHDWDIAQTARALGMAASILKRKIDSYEIEPVSSPPPTPGGENQRTISKGAVLYGRGLHTGYKTGLIIEPLPPGGGVRFGNLTSAETVEAHVEFVAGTNHATYLRNGTLTARTIEHIMSALHAYKISNILIKVNEEVPIMDGSALEFCRLLEEAGIEDQEQTREELRVEEVHEVGEPGDKKGYIRIEPADSLSVSYLIDYPDPIGKESYLYEHRDAQCFRREIAPARTFGFVSELDALGQMGLAEGGRWDNVILVSEGRVVNTPLRFPNEFVRHKILDVIGDLYLLGRPVRGKVIAERSGHRHNVALVKKLVDAYG